MRMGSEQNRFPEQESFDLVNCSERDGYWVGCWGALSCFGSQKGGKRIVPASRIPKSNPSSSQPNGSQASGLTNQATAMAPSLLAPPSSPASFTNSALPSTAQSPSCFLSLSANSPGAPSSTMFATGPYAHETQLVSPPVFSTFTTEPSTAPLTPPPELAHLTTPSSPDVPFAQFLSSSFDLKGAADKTKYIASSDLQTTYSLYPGSPASRLISPSSRASGGYLSSSFLEQELSPNWDPAVSPQDGKYSRSGSARLFGFEKTNAPNMASRDSNFFCPATFAQFYLDNPPFPHTGGRLSVSKDSDVYSTTTNGYQNRQNKTPKQDVEELEAYRASFGFSADEIISTSQYKEITDVAEDTFTMSPLTSNKLPTEERLRFVAMDEAQQSYRADTELQSQRSIKSDSDTIENASQSKVLTLCSGYEDHTFGNRVSGSSSPGNYCNATEEDEFSKLGLPKNCRKYEMGLSCSDAEIDYGRGRLRGCKRDFSWRD